VPPETVGAPLFSGTWIDACLAIGKLVADALEHAHARGVLHRDLKPSNLMLLADGRTVVLDFGLAQAEGDARLTRTGSAAGSPAYMAPEQVRAEPADERTDVYGLGATLYALLGVRPPFPLGDPLALRTRITHGERQPLRGAKALPPELLLVLDAAMDVDRGRRHASAAAFAEDLQAVLDGRPIHARALPLPVKLRRFAQRHRALAAGGVVALLFAAVTPSLLWWQQRTANTRLASAVDVSLDAVEQLLSRAAASQVRYQPAMQRLAADMLEDAVALFTRLADEPDHRARVDRLRCRTLSELGRVRLNLGEFDAAQAANSAALAAIPEQPDSAMQLLLAEVRSQLAYIAVRRGRPEDLAVHLAAADAALALAIADPTTRDSALADRGRLSEYHAKVQEDAGDRAGAIATLRRGLADLEATHKPTALAGLRLALATHLHRAGPQHDDEARQLLLAVRAIDDGGEYRAAVWPPPRMQAAQAELELGTIAVDRGELAAAQPHFTAALTRFHELVLDYPQDPTVRRLRARTSNHLGNAANAAKDFARARRLLEQGLADVAIALEGNGDDEPTRSCRASLLRSLTTTLRELRDWDALERTARDLGAPPDRRETTGRAARELLRCAEAVPQRAEALRAEALGLLERAAAVGLAIDANDALYAPWRDEPRFRALLPTGERPR
jgi:tetratricopeptide (TPR) repeat protein